MTRDIHRGDKPHFFLKEIGESGESARRTLRGKFEVREGMVEFHLGNEALGRGSSRLRLGTDPTRFLYRQGTAAVAGQGSPFSSSGRSLARRSRSPCGHEGDELSGHCLSPDMSDVLVVAVSQSGTTTDTNRTVDLLKERGAHVLGIVNRRNSDLVYKAHGVLYTSDGRDIEMSVASTKAFYARWSPVECWPWRSPMSSERSSRGDPRRALDLVRLPDLMARTLALEPGIAELAAASPSAASLGDRRERSGEDRRRRDPDQAERALLQIDRHRLPGGQEAHRPLIRAARPRLRERRAPGKRLGPREGGGDLQAHKSLPVVIATRRGSFDPYAVGTVKVPSGQARWLPPRRHGGHLFGYHAASPRPRRGAPRAIRAEVLRGWQGEVSAREGAGTSRPGRAGALEAPRSSSTGSSTWRAFFSPGALTPGSVPPRRRGSIGRSRRSSAVFLRPRSGGPREAALAAFSEAISELSRPIDAIKHQAKTVTVGISRGEAGLARGVSSAWR